VAGLVYVAAFAPDEGELLIDRVAASKDSLATESVQDWIALRRVELARGLLEDSAMTISQVAYAVGFGSTESLRRHFRATTGTSASDYRRTFSAKAGSAKAGLAPLDPD
jgi:AraC-like DNA-binding protein